MTLTFILPTAALHLNFVVHYALLPVRSNKLYCCIRYVAAFVVQVSGVFAAILYVKQTVVMDNFIKDDTGCPI